MNFDCDEFYKVIVNTQNINHSPLKEIKVTNKFYDCVISKCRVEIKLEDTSQGIVANFTGIPIVIDDTIDDDYELVF